MTDTFGTRLRRERERREICLTDIAARTKIKASLFEQLERDDASHWPSGIFRRSFMRAYANAVGLDVDATVREFLECFPDPATPPPVDAALQPNGPASPVEVSPEQDARSAAEGRTDPQTDAGRDRAAVHRRPLSRRCPPTVVCSSLGRRITLRYRRLDFRLHGRLLDAIWRDGSLLLHRWRVGAGEQPWGVPLRAETDRREWRRFSAGEDSTPPASGRRTDARFGSRIQGEPLPGRAPARSARLERAPPARATARVSWRGWRWSTSVSRPVAASR